MRHHRNQPALRHNDPKGEKYFYFNEEKDEVYFCWHIDKRTTVDRKATDLDKISHVMAWRDFMRAQEDCEVEEVGEQDPPVASTPDSTRQQHRRGRPRRLK